MIDNQMHLRFRTVGAWCAIFYPLLFGLGMWLLADMIPPHSPTASANEIASIYTEYRLGIRMAMILVMFSAFCYVPLTAVIAYYISRIEGHVGVLTITQGLGGMGNVCLTFYPAMWWMITAFRPDLSPELLRFGNDAAWLQFVGGLTIFYPILISMALASLADKDPDPIFPRWFGFFNLWLVVLFLPGLVIFFVKTGPFAWNGILAFWLPLTVFILWFLVLFHSLRRAIAKDAAG